MLLLFVLLPCTMAETVQVNTEYGPLRGFTYRDPSGIEANVFLGVPYAKAPVGQLRFEKPIPPDPWTEPLECTKMGPSCVAMQKGDVWRPGGSEDCLFLNIIAPRQNETNVLLPVLVHTHGGGYEIGNALRYEYQRMTELYATRGVIVVTTQYRLGALGYFTSGRRDMPGNMGSFDQAESFRFIYRNIKAFGGDPSRIFAWGVSAGGASSSQLSLSPYSRDYIAGTIEMSGTAWNSWARKSPSEESSKLLAAHIGCDWAERKLKNCLKNKTIEELWAAMEYVSIPTNNLGFLRFSPRFDGDFFPKEIDKLAAEVPKKPVLVGAHDKEMGFFAILGLRQVIHTRSVPEDKWQSFGEKEAVDYIRTAVAREEYFGKRAPEVAERIVDYYLNRERPANPSYRFFLERQTDLESDLLFTVPARLSADIRSSLDWPVYVYRFDHFARDIYDDRIPLNGSCHVNEQSYFTGAYGVRPHAWTERERKVQQDLIDTLVSFVYQGRPSTKDVPNWPLFSSKNGEFVRIAHPQFETRSGYFEQPAEFWKGIEREFGFDAISSLSRVRNSMKNEL